MGLKSFKVLQNVKERGLQKHFSPSRAKSKTNGKNEPKKKKRRDGIAKAELTVRGLRVCERAHILFSVTRQQPIYQISDIFFSLSWVCIFSTFETLVCLKTTQVQNLLGFLFFYFPFLKKVIPFNVFNRQKYSRAHDVLYVILVLRNISIFF